MLPLLYADELPMSEDNTDRECNSRMPAEDTDREHTYGMPAENTNREHNFGILVTS